jgi:hypothetical protein
LRHPPVGTSSGSDLLQLGYVSRGKMGRDIQRPRRVASRYAACFRLISSQIGRRFHERPAQQEALRSRRLFGPGGAWINDGRTYDRWAVLQSALEGAHPACRSGW